MIEEGNKQRRGKKTQKKILETALKLFADKGYDKVTVDEICKKSETSKGSFYQHFSSKSSIFLAKFLEADAYYAEVIESLPKNMDVFEKLSMFNNKAFSYLNDQMGKDLLKVIYSSALTSKEHTYFLNKDRELTRIFISFAEEIKSMLPAGSSRRVEDLVMMMNQTMLGAIYYWCITTDDRNLPEVAQDLTDTMIRGLKSLIERN
ncbi:TetR/AcrR family transcriptional regulator [Sporosarcina sp. 179-K 3D1 HS]|uniref:TetR/AcrR family transcriptional regulator n=1 Tax=Sporosarcina sp. 179-K 3D1 HS TaxID=3232169 RepID=UPI0039A1D34E